MLVIGVTLTSMKTIAMEQDHTKKQKNVYTFSFDAIHKIHSLYAILSNVSFLKKRRPHCKKMTYARKWNMQKDKTSLVFLNISH